MSSRDQFEQAYAEDNGMTLLQVVEQRMASGSYRVPAMSRAWFWWQESRAAAVVELPPDRTADMSPSARVLVHFHQGVRKNMIEAIEVAGLKVAP